MELTILMPCLNEALTVGTCIRKARAYLEKNCVTGEVLVADNGSTDGSQALAAAAGARVIQIRDKGYGAALIGGIEAATGRFVIMADSDDSYDLTNLDSFLQSLRNGFKLVVGNRFKGLIMPGAMPLLNRYLGNPTLSFIGRRLFSSDIGDFHCGIRGFERDAIRELNLRAHGMEFASEMVVKACLARLAIAEVPATLSPDGRQRKPHLRPWRDGWRHLRFMLLRSPTWLFLYPGLLMTTLGLLGAALLIPKPIHIPGVFTLDINALLYFSMAAVVGTQISFFSLFAQAFAKKLNLTVKHPFAGRLVGRMSQEIAVGVGVMLSVIGACGATYAIVRWGHLSFGALMPSDVMRITIPSVTTLAIGAQMIFGGLLLSFISLD